MSTSMFFTIHMPQRTSKILLVRLTANRNSFLFLIRITSQPFYITTLLINNRPIKIIIDAGSLVTLIPKSKFNNTTVMKPVMTEYRDVNDKRIKFERKSIASGEIDGIKQQLEPLITTKKTLPLLGLDSRLDEKTGNNTRNGQNHHKQQLLYQRTR